jgi:glycosyltransferase involved in cell wall biosynthesis
MKLTICLVTKGRELYLSDILKSFENLLLDPAITVLLIDNGSDPSIRESLADWQLKNSKSVKLVRLASNDSRPSTIWLEVISAGVDWVIFPGDDDELVPDIIAEWRSSVKNDPDLVAFASTAAVMDENGVLTGELLSPTAGLVQSRIDQIALGFHQPPFVWPSLFLRATKVNAMVPPSRYVFDWWVGINLFLAGNVEISNSIGLKYRVHSEQESNLAPIRRKYFEASLWLDELIRSKEFTTWIKSMTDEDRLLFWKKLNQKSPVYGDPFFARQLIFSLARLLIDTSLATSTGEQIVIDLATHSGVFIRDGESIHLIRGASQVAHGNFGNVRINATVDSCNVLLDACNMVGRYGAKIFVVACVHSKKKSKDLVIDCGDLNSGNIAINADRVISALTNMCETRGDFEIALTNGERAGLSILRSVKRRLPGRLTLTLRRLKNTKL